ncbi:putative bifunctional diguanylate cyclase/phosphodiesterase [Rubrivivax rivuli]|uniref:EAL domain-containing protein n=1 Tax=Rubrivivax rivuli TaxID=1862385 RepID=A0A437RR36_9BURK|nr:EAL domain-containing protein [Rubrivivax rivuli]RVU49253.1 EAL domain-containing protein [Rubrivivax rivuli]
MDLQPREARYAALNLLHHPVWIFDIDLRRVHWSNNAALHIWSAPSLAELCARDMGADMSESVARRLAQYQSDFISQGATFNEQWTLYPGGKPVSLTVRMSGHRLDDGRMAMLCEGREQAVEEPESLRSVEALLHTPVMITLFGEDGRPLYRNPAARASVRRLDEKLAERIVDTRSHASLLAALASEGMATQTLAVHTETGPRWHEISARRCKDAVTGQAALLVSEVDVSAIKRTEAQAQYMALHDALTGLPNRSHLTQRFEMVLGAIRDAQQQAALIFIDLDHFKDVNDTLGHAAGDALLIEVSRRLRGAVRGSDLVARLGGDEFLILMVASDIRSEIERVRLRLTRAVAEPVHLGGRDLHVTASIGVALYPQHGSDVQTLMRNADLAMYSAKEGGRNALAYYDAAMADAVEGRTALEAELRLAFERREFEVHYQPIVEALSGRIVGAEALVRWRHPQRGLVAPDVFIPLCESTGLIRRLGALVFSSAAHQQVAWAQAGHVLRIAVNLSARQLRGAELLSDLAAALRASGADPRQLQLEITESMLLGQDNELLALFQSLQDLHLGLALDDFGTGYSNLAYLQRFPIDTLKIDKTFIQGLQNNRALAELIVSMARLMRLRVVAEGVETQEQLAWVRAQGIEFCQGYLFARPLPVADFGALLAAR